MRRQKKKKKKITSLLHPPQNTACSLWDQRCSLPALRKKTSALRFLSLKTLKPFCSRIPADSTISWLRPPFPDPVRVTVVSPPATKHIGFLLLYALAALMAICVTNTVAIYTSEKRSGLSVSRVPDTVFTLIVQKPCESRGGRPGLFVLMSLMDSVDVKLY